MKFEDLKALIDQAKLLGIECVEVEGVKYTIRAETQILPSEVPDLEPKDIVAPGFDEPTDEEILYWATPYYDELQERKKHREETRAMDEDLRQTG